MTITLGTTTTELRHRIRLVHATTGQTDDTATEAA